MRFRGWCSQGRQVMSCKRHSRHDRSLAPCVWWRGPVRCQAMAAVAASAAVLFLPLAMEFRPAEAAGGAAQMREPKAQGAPTAKAAHAMPGNLVGHGGPVKALAVDIAAHRVLSGSFDYAMTLWDVGGDVPQQLKRFDAHEGAVNAVAFVPPVSGGDARRAVAAGDDGSLWLYDLDAGKLVHRFKGHEAKVMAVAVSADGRYAATASWDRTARLWDLAALQDGPVLAGHKGPVNAVAFSSDGAVIYTGSYDGTIAAWRRADGGYLRPVLKHGWGINVLARIAGGEQLVWGSLNGAAGVVDGGSGAVVAELPAHERPVLALDVIDKPGLVATGGGDGLVRVLRIGDWKLIEEHVNPRGPVWALGFAQDGRAMYYGGLDDVVTFWQVSPRQPFEPIEGEFPRRFQVGSGEAGALPSPLDLGKRDFARKCSVCHTLEQDGANRAGPTLHGVFGRRAGAVAGYPYSPALRSATIVWTEETISKLFELGPEHYTPGSKMPLQRITDAGQRGALVAYLKQATQPRQPDK